tara:strand:- start:149 stop:637 length:489 start_codon:yes stop_codon:yes gene_type:complete
MKKSDLSTIFEWRNHREIRKRMFNQNKIKFDEHQDWFKEASQNPNKVLLIFEANSKPMGYINFNFNSKKESDWGFYLAPESEKGIGTIMGKLALNYAFKKLKFNKVMAQAISSNHASIKYHIKMGFNHKNTLKNSFYNEGKYEDIMCFELSSNFWNKNAHNL